ncbi:MAG: hypothetical protein ACE5I7_13425 [Candidatus Binatia bacterium]
MTERKATLRRPYQYKESGLTNLFLIGITVHQCEQCRSILVDVPCRTDLYRSVALSLIKKPGFLMGEEIRYLRTWAGFPAQKFAALLRVSPHHLSRVENGHLDSLGSAGDSLARILPMAVKEGAQAAFETLLGLADAPRRAVAESALPLVFELTPNRWTARD